MKKPSEQIEEQRAAGKKTCVATIGDVGTVTLIFVPLEEKPEELPEPEEATGNIFE